MLDHEFVIPAKAGTIQEEQLVQEEQLGPRFRGDDDFRFLR
jgi:hypothetical protein